MTQLKTNKEELEKFISVSGFVGGGYPEYGTWYYKTVHHLAHDALLAHNLQERIDKVLAMKMADVTVWDEPMLLEIQTLLKTPKEDKD